MARVEGDIIISRPVEEVFDFVADECNEQIRLQPEAYFDLGEYMLMFFVYHGRGEHSGAEVATPAMSVAQWRDGLLTHSTVYLDRAHALRDLGVTEDELEPIAP